MRSHKIPILTSSCARLHVKRPGGEMTNQSPAEVMPAGPSHGWRASHRDNFLPRPRSMEGPASASPGGSLQCRVSCVSPALPSEPAGLYSAPSADWPPASVLTLQRDPRIAKLPPYVSLLCIVVGVAWLFLLPLDEYSRKTYISENALLPGQVHTYFSGSDHHVLRAYRHEVAEVADQDNLACVWGRGGRAIGWLTTGPLQRQRQARDHPREHRAQGRATELHVPLGGGRVRRAKHLRHSRSPPGRCHRSHGSGRGLAYDRGRAQPQWRASCARPRAIF
jgi:hypothetical protein